MAFVVIVLGVLMGLTGAAVMARGAPYYMLEWGIAYLAAGAVALSTGLILVVMGVMLRRLGRIARQVEALSRPPERPVAPPVTAPVAPAPAPMMAGAAALSTGAALAAAAALVPQSADNNAADRTDADLRRASPDEPESAESLAPAATALGIDAGAEPHPDVAPPALQTDLAETARDILSAVSRPPGEHDPFARIDEALRELRQGAFGGEGPPPLEADPPRDHDLRPDLPAPESAPVPVASAAEVLPGDLDDLRTVLLDAADAAPSGLSEGHAPEPDVPPVPDSVEPDGAEPEQPEPVLPEPSAAVAERIAAEPPAAEPERPGHPLDIAPAAAPAVDAPPQEARSRPTASDDGVIAAYTVGDSAFTMYADGRIEASTPEGQFTFGSMEELRSFMAERRRP